MPSATGVAGATGAAASSFRILALVLLACRASATTCAEGSYSYDSGSCAACPSGATFVAATGLCAPAAAPADTAFYLSGTSAEGVAAFPNAPAVSYVTGVFCAANGALSFASGAGFLSMTPAAGSALLAALPTGNAPFTASAWVKCAAGSVLTAVSWGVPSLSGAPSPAFVTLAAGAAFNYAGVGRMAGTVSVFGSGFSSPYGVAVDAVGNVYVADYGNNAVKKISLDGTISVLGSGFSFPHGLAVDAAGTVFVADTSNNVVKKISLDRTVSVLSWGFSALRGVAVDAAGNVIVADTGNSAVKIIVQLSSQSICDASWHHLAVSHGNGAPSATKTYLDGALIATSQQTFAIPSDGTAAFTVNWNGATGTSAGAVSDLRLYSRALLAAEVLTLSQPPLTGYPNTAVVPAVPVLGATSYSFSCAAGSSGSGATQIRGLDRAWSWAAGASPSCTPCVAGSFAAAPNSAACALCPPGTYSSAGASSCTPCPAGTYGNSAGLASSSCTGSCDSTMSCPLGTAYPLPAVLVRDLSCAASGARAVPSSLGVLVWPAANPSNPQHVDLIIAPLALCQQLGGTCSTLASNTVVGADSVTRYIVGTAAALNLEAAEALTCSTQ